MSKVVPARASMIVYTSADGRAGKPAAMLSRPEHLNMVKAWLAAHDVEYLIVGTLGDAAGNVFTLGAADLSDLLTEALPYAMSLMAHEAIPQSGCVALSKDLSVTVDSRWNELKVARLAG